MLKSIEGVYRNGKVELLEPVPPDASGKIIITFLEQDSIDLLDRGIDTAQAEDLRRRLKTFAEDWDHPEMDVYDVN